MIVCGICQVVDKKQTFKKAHVVYKPCKKLHKIKPAIALLRDERRDVFSNGENIFSMVEIFTLLFCVGVFGVSVSCGSYRFLLHCTVQSDVYLNAV